MLISKLFLLILFVIFALYIIRAIFSSKKNLDSHKSSSMVLEKEIQMVSSKRSVPLDIGDRVKRFRKKPRFREKRKPLKQTGFRRKPRLLKPFFIDDSPKCSIR